MIAVLVPMLGRAQRIEPLLSSLTASTEVPCRVVFLCSPGDHEVIDTLDRSGRSFVVVDWECGPGDFARKIGYGYRLTDEPWIFQAASDVTFESGWDTALMRCAEETGALVIGTRDGGNPAVEKGRHSTHTLVARSYCDDPGASFDGPGTVFSEAYDHQSVDVELVELAKMRGVWAFCHESVVTHHHPLWGKGEMDTTYERGLAKGREDARLYSQRKRGWLRAGKMQRRV